MIHERVILTRCYADVAELADAPDLGSGVPDVQVQVLSSAWKECLFSALFFICVAFCVAYIAKNVICALVNCFSLPVGTMGLCIESSHPALEQFPNAGCTTPQPAFLCGIGEVCANSHDRGRLA